MQERRITVIGGGPAGAEAAYQAASRGAAVRLYEMRPHAQTPMHSTGLLAELTGAASFGMDQPDRATGLLLAELRRLGSLIVQAADATRMDSADLHTVDRHAFAEYVTRRIEAHENIEVLRKEADGGALEGPAVIAGGPMVSSAIARRLFGITGEEFRFFYGATEPLIEGDSIDREATWLQSRFGEDQPVHLNCPLDEAQLAGSSAVLAEAGACLPEGITADMVLPEYVPLEVSVAEGDRALTRGPLNPAGLSKPGSDVPPSAVCRLLPETADHWVWRAVGMHTGLPPGEQERLLHNIGGLENVRLVRYGALHRAAYVNSPSVLEPTYELRQRCGVFLAGGITGLQDYAAAAASGWLAGVNGSRLLCGEELVTFPAETLCGGLSLSLTAGDPALFRPVTATFGLLAARPGDEGASKEERRAAQTERALTALDRLMEEMNLR